MMSIVAVGTSTGPLLAWLIVYLDQSPDWRDRVIQEVDTFILEHSPGVSKSLTSVLAGIPLTTWDVSLPTLDLCLRETMRLVLSGTTTRRNVGSDIELEGHLLRQGDFLMYMAEDVHMDGTLYPDPLCFNPARPPIQATQLGFLGWGAGNHRCPGQHMATAMIKIISVLLLSHFTLEGLDKQGHPLKAVPKPRASLFNVGHPMEPVLFAYKARATRQ